MRRVELHFAFGFIILCCTMTIKFPDSSVGVVTTRDKKKKYCRQNDTKLIFLKQSIKLSKTKQNKTKNLTE